MISYAEGIHGFTERKYTTNLGNIARTSEDKGIPCKISDSTIRVHELVKICLKELNFFSVGNKYKKKDYIKQSVHLFC